MKIREIFKLINGVFEGFFYRLHNRKVFDTGDKYSSKKPIILMEFNDMHSAHISYSYLANQLAKLHGAQVKAYVPREIKDWRHRLIFYIKIYIGWGSFGIYKSFGVNEFIQIRLNHDQQLRARTLYKNVLNNILCTRDVEDLKVNGIWIGDLIYDSYLMKYKQPTIDLSSSKFHEFLIESMKLFIFWLDYLDKNEVRGINVSHCVYNLAIPLRIAVEKQIDVFQVNITHVYRLSKKNLFAYNDFNYFPKVFSNLPSEVREAGVALAKSRIKRRFAGEVGVDMAYSTKSAYGPARHNRLLRESSRKKILIATHCFFDSPHGYGKNIFPDFFEWLKFLGDMSLVTDYDWYIKTHPDFLTGTKEIIDGFLARYSKFNLLPSDASHLQIINEGIDLALTANGTIAFEYAALGVLVINASMNNPHIAYNFNLHARDVEHYRELLENLEGIKFNIDKAEVLEYYFMRNIFNTQNLFFENYQETIFEIGGYKEQFSPSIYRCWLSKWTPKRHQEISDAIHNFILSQDFRMDYKHYGREFSVESLRIEA